MYQARDTTLDRDVALKVLPEAFTSDPDRLARFEREAKVLASLNHPNIGGIHGLEDSGGTKALVLELVEGPTLADRIAQGPISVDEALPIAKQIAEALEAAHEAGAIHRDLKPANIKVKDDGTVKVLDFGLAKQQPDSDAPASQATTRDTLTGARALIGTPAYMAPEQVLAAAVDARSDIFSFGVVLYELLAGTHPFRQRTRIDTLAAIVRDPPTPPRDRADPTTYAIFEKLLAKDPADRYQTFDDVRSEVRRLSDSTSGWIAVGVEAAGGRRTPFVGRETERAKLDAFVERTIRGRGGMVLIGGEPGAGKTRLVEQVLESARQRRCLQRVGTVSWPAAGISPRPHPHRPPTFRPTAPGPHLASNRNRF